MAGHLALTWVTSGDAVGERLRAQLTTCWRDVANAGGAVGFPFVPVAEAEVREAVDVLLAGLSPGLVELLVAVDDARSPELLGWLQLAGNDHALTRHWATVLRVQTALAHRGRGVGRALMTEAARRGREERGLRQLHLVVRGGMGLEAFYARLGWSVVGAWPGALRFAEDDVRDEVLMVLSLV